MGNACGTGPIDDAFRKASKQIDAQLSKDKKEYERETKLLLLGPGESGKSTVLKQMKIIHMSGFTEQERASFVSIIHSNILSAMGTLVKSLIKTGDIQKLSEKAQQCSQMFSGNDALALDELTPQHVEAVKTLWTEDHIRKLFQSSELHIIDSAKFFFDQIDRISAKDFRPTEQDILYARVRTTGITEVIFKLQALPFRVVDVGGQRSERKKWVHCFQDVTAILFVVAISEYDQVLREDATVPRMEESLNLFEEIVNCNWFVKTAVILFLNKSDLFEEKAKRIDLGKYYSDYTGGLDPQAGIRYLKTKFQALNRNSEKSIYTHVTCATNTENIKFVFQAVQNIFLDKNINQMGIM